MHRWRGGHSELICGYTVCLYPYVCHTNIISVSAFQIITVICEDLHACPAGELTHASVTACVKRLSVTNRYVTHLSLTLLHISHRQRSSISCWAGTSRIRWVRGAQHNTSLGSTECWVRLISRVSNCHSCALCSGFYSAYSGRVPKFFQKCF